MNNLDIQLINGDCIEVMQELIQKGIMVDLTVTSPPYDNLRTYNETLKWDFYIFKQVAQLLYEITKNGGVVVWVVGDATINGSETCTSFKQALYFKEIGFNLHDTMIYQKYNPIPNTGNWKRYNQSFEYMFVFSKGTPKTINLIKEERRNLCNDKRTERIKKWERNKDGTFKEPCLYKINQFVPKCNVWNYKVGLYNTTNDKIAFNHPAIFPEKLANDHILSWSNQNDLVLDPFMGSGTTGKMSLINNRKFIGIEKVQEYYDISCKRIKETKNNIQLNLF